MTSSRHPSDDDAPHPAPPSGDDPTIAGLTAEELGLTGADPVPAGEDPTVAGLTAEELGLAGADPIPAGEDPTVAGLTAEELGLPGASEKTVVFGTAPPAEQTMITSGAAPASSEATMITSNPYAARGGLRGRLEVIAGKETGRVVELTDGTRVLGRGRDCDVILLDIQISRQHVELVVEPRGVLLRDLGSGNGTQVNGADVDELYLSEGDEITVGDHVLRFEAVRAPAPPPSAALPAVPAQAAPSLPTSALPTGLPSVAARRAARRSGGKGRRLAAMGTLAALLIVGVFGAKLALTPPPDDGPAEPPPAQVAQARFNEGVALFKDGEYAKAKEAFVAAAALAPRNEDIARYLSGTERELEAEAAIARGNEALSKGDWDAARAAFRSVPDEGVAPERGPAGVERVDAAQARAIVAEADAVLAAEKPTLEDCDRALELYASAKEVVPGFGPALDGEERARTERERIIARNEDLRDALAQQKEEERRRALAAAAAARQAKLDACRDQFDGGRFREAIACLKALAADGADAELQRQAGRRLGALDKFPAAYDRGMGAAGTKQTKGAIKYLSIAEPGAKAMSPKGPVYRKIADALADMHYLEGRIGFNGKRYAEAYRHWSTAVGYRPEHRYAGAGLQDLTKLAEEKYLSGYIKKDINRSEAVELFEQVLAMTAPGTELHDKAGSRLKELAAR